MLTYLWRQFAHLWRHLFQSFELSRCCLEGLFWQFCCSGKYMEAFCFYFSQKSGFIQVLAVSFANFFSPQSVLELLHLIPLLLHIGPKRGTRHKSVLLNVLFFKRLLLCSPLSPLWVALQLSLQKGKRLFKPDYRGRAMDADVQWSKASSSKFATTLFI